jgi:tetratricopeptide (TPR) repeat protein
MNMSIRVAARWLVLLLLLAGPTGYGVAQSSPPEAAGYPTVPIDGTELRTIQSAIVGQEYLLKVRLPEGYERSEKRYPVLYLLDGDFAFAMATDIVQYLEWGGIPELIIVSPAYGSKRAPRTGGNNMRNRDLVPFALPNSPEEPGAENFLRFIGEELIPYVDANFRTDPADRTLWGYSLGARFGLYALFSQPGLFARYIFVDGFANEIISMEAEFAARHTDLPATVHLSSGVPRAQLTRFMTSLRERQYPSLSMEFSQLAGITHFAVGAEGLTRGLKYVFNGKSIFEEMLHALQTADLASAIALYHERRRTAPQEYGWSEGELDELGVSLRLMGRTEEALEIYRMNVELHPDAWRPYNSLADAYLRSGDTARAAANFERALALNPQNAHAAEMLRRLRTP